MENLVLLIKRALQVSAIVISVGTGLAGCGGGGSDSAAGSAVARDATSTADSVNPQVVSLNATYRGQTYKQWVVSFWQWALAIPLPPASPYPHPFQDCNNRHISVGQTGNVWYWSAPDDAPLRCDQRATIIPAGTSIFLSTLDLEASSLDAPPFYAATAADQLAIAQQFANYIQDMFVTIDGIPVANVTAYRTTTDRFSFFAPTPWIFNKTGGNGTAVADGYYLLLKPLPAGIHTIHYGGTFIIPAGVLGHKAVTIPKDVTLLITMGS
jgi:hypothetical protein